MTSLRNNFAVPRIERSKKFIVIQFYQKGRAVTDAIGKLEVRKRSPSWPNSAEGNAEAEGVLIRLRNELEQGNSWKEMYDILCSFCDELKEENQETRQQAPFNEPRLEEQVRARGSTNESHCRIHWQQEGKIVEDHFGSRQKKNLTGAWLPVAKAKIFLPELLAVLREESEWLKKYQCVKEFLQKKCPCSEADKMELARKDSDCLEAAEERAKLGSCQADPLMGDLLVNIESAEVLVERTGTSTNTFPGFRNVGNTCFVNSVLQLFMHSAGLRSRIASACELEIANFEYERDNKDKYEKLQKALQKQLRLHSLGKWTTHVPLEILRCTLALDGMNAGQHCDALDCFRHFNRSLLGRPQSSSVDEEVWCHGEMQPLQYPRLNMTEPLQHPLSICQVLEMVADDNRGCIERSKPPATLVLGFLPYHLTSSTTVEWISPVITEWDGTIDLEKLFRRSDMDAELQLQGASLSQQRRTTTSHEFLWETLYANGLLPRKLCQRACGTIFAKQFVRSNFCEERFGNQLLM